MEIANIIRSSQLKKEKIEEILCAIVLKNLPTTSDVSDAIDNALHMEKYFFRKKNIDSSIARNWRLENIVPKKVDLENDFFVHKTVDKIENESKEISAEKQKPRIIQIFRLTNPYIYNKRKKIYELLDKDNENSAAKAEAELQKYKKLCPMNEMIHSNLETYDKNNKSSTLERQEAGTNSSTAPILRRKTNPEESNFIIQGPNNYEERLQPAYVRKGKAY